MRSRGLFQIGLVGIVVKAKAQREKWPREILRQWRKRIRGRDAAPRRTVERHIARGRHQTHVRNFSVLRNGKLNREFPFFHFRGFRNQVIPVFLHILQNAL